MFLELAQLFILVPALLGLKGNLEMTLASRLSTQVRDTTVFPEGFSEYGIFSEAGRGQPSVPTIL